HERDDPRLRPSVLRDPARRRILRAAEHSRGRLHRRRLARADRRAAAQGARRPRAPDDGEGVAADHGGAVTAERRPPRLLVKTMAVTFVTVALVLIVVFLVVTFSVRRQVRDTVAANLES